MKATSAEPGPEVVSHPGVVMTGEDGQDGRKAFFIDIEAREGREEEVVAMLQDILNCVDGEPAPGPRFGVRFSRTRFGIFETFPDVAGRDAHVAGGGGDVFRDVERMNRILSRPAHVQKIDVLLMKQSFSWAVDHSDQ